MCGHTKTTPPHTESWICYISIVGWHCIVVVRRKVYGAVVVQPFCRMAVVEVFARWRDGSDYGLILWNESLVHPRPTWGVGSHTAVHNNSLFTQGTRRQDILVHRSLTTKAELGSDKCWASRLVAILPSLSTAVSWCLIFPSFRWGDQTETEKCLVGANILWKLLWRYRNSASVSDDVETVSFVPPIKE